MTLFQQLKSSLEEAIEIEKGNKKASKITGYPIADVKRIRAKLNVSQAVFAQALGTSVDTVKSWETKRRNPTGLAAKALLMIEDDPSLFEKFSSY